MKLKEMAQAVYLGASIETVMPAGGNATYWRQVISRYIATHITGKVKPKRRRQSTRRTGKPGKRTNYAANVIGRAMIETVDRVNGVEDK